MTEQEFFCIYDKLDYYYLEYNLDVFDLLFINGEEYYHTLPTEEKNDFLSRYAKLSAMGFEKLGGISFFDDVIEYVNGLDVNNESEFYRKVNEYLDELEEEHPLNKSILYCRFIYNKKYAGIDGDKNLSFDENLRKIAVKYYEPNEEYDQAYKIYCALKDYTNARRLRYNQAYKLFSNDEFSKSNYYFRCALDYDDAEQYAEWTSHLPLKYSRFKKEVGNDYIEKRLQELQPKLFNEYKALLIKYGSKEKAPLLVRRKMNKMFEELYKYVSDIEDELVERYSERVGETIALHWVGEIPMITLD